MACLALWTAAGSAVGYSSLRCQPCQSAVFRDTVLTDRTAEPVSVGLIPSPPIAAGDSKAVYASRTTRPTGGASSLC